MEFLKLHNVLAQVHFPQSLLLSDLDRYLSNGWFRMGQTIFTTNFLNFNERFYSAIWLRIKLDDYRVEKSALRLARLNSAYSISIQKAEVTAEKEDLFLKYRSSISFEASHALAQLLYGSFTKNIFNSFELTVRDKGKLIACGIFDVGSESAAGITSFYDPAYKRTSLGKLVIHEKIKYCHELGLKYFYPGYFVPDYPRFDYKLGIQTHAQEFLKLSTSSWVPASSFQSTDIPINEMIRRLHEFGNVCKRKKVAGSLYFYDYFDANLVHSLSHLELFDFPVFFAPTPDVTLLFPAIVYFDLRDQQFHVAQVDSMWSSGAENIVDDHYAAHLLKITSEIFSSTDPGQVAEALSSYLAVAS